jgi:hypothetical protein
MNFGFNTNVRVGNSLYHVQTEDRGPAHPFLDTVVYQAGRVVHKRSTCYQDLAASLPQGESLAQQMHTRLVQQHRAVIAELEGGTLELNFAPGAPLNHENEANAREELEVRLLNSGSWLASGKAQLEVEVCQTGSAQPPAGASIEVIFENGQIDLRPVRGHADEAGRATLKFPLPPTVADGTVLQIRAVHGDLIGELRFRLRARERVPAPVSPQG